MFDADKLAVLYKDHRSTLDALVELEKRLNQRFYGMERAVECMALAVLTGEAMVMIGPPGTAKSRLVRSFCNLVGVLDDAALNPSGGTTTEAKDEKYFEYLLTQFTEPSELFGYFDLAKLFGEHKMEKADAGMMQKAEVVFLDEVFNASSAILNSLLTFMNERKFHDRGMVHHTPMRLLFSATNQPPREEGLGAVYDRFLLRCRLDNVVPKPESLAALVSAAWQETHDAPKSTAGDQPFANLLDGCDSYRNKVDALTHSGALKIQQDSPLFNRLADIVAELRRKELSQMSNRRLVKFSGVILASSLMRAARANGDAPRIEPVDLAVILHFGLDAEDSGTVTKLLAHLLGQ